MRVPPGVEGTVIDVKIFSRSGVRRDKRYKEEVAKQVAKIDADFEGHSYYLTEMVINKIVYSIIIIISLLWEYWSLS